MPPEDESDDDAPGHAPLPPEDRLWRHPSEIAAAATPPAPGPRPAPRARRRSRPWGLLVAGLAGATVSLGLVAVTGLWRTQGVERQVTSPASKVTASNPVNLRAGDGVAGLVTSTSPSVMGLRVTVEGTERSGSAVALGPTGHLVTSAALVRGNTAIIVGLPDGSSVSARVLGADPVTGLAVLDVGSTRTVAARESTRRPAIGSTAVIVPGSMTGGPGLVSAGIVRGIGRPAPTPDGPLHDLIQTDQTPAPESAGGALVGPDGAVVGIALLPSADPDDPTSSSGWAVPVDVARQVVDDISEDGKAHHVWLGVSIADPSAPSGGDTGSEPPGALVTEVEPGSPASKVELVSGDRITALDGAPVGSMADLISILRQHRPGDRVAIVTWHEERSRTAEVVLREKDAG